MPEEKKEKTLEELQQEYSKFCAVAGQLQYQIFALKKDLALVNEQIQDVNIQASKIKPAEAPKGELKAVE